MIIRRASLQARPRSRRRVPRLARAVASTPRYVAEGLLTQDKARAVMQAIEELRGRNRFVNEVDSDAENGRGEREHLSRRLSHAELVAELARREALLRGVSTEITDQWRVYSQIVEALIAGTPLRLLVQASAGTGDIYSSVWDGSVRVAPLLA